MKLSEQPHDLKFYSDVIIAHLTPFPTNGGGGEQLFLKGLNIFGIWQYDVEYELHRLFCVALLSHSCIEYINFQRDYI